MKFSETEIKVKTWIEKIDQVNEPDMLEELQDVEILESFIRDEIYQYCISRKYAVEGFPFEQLEKIAKEEFGYDDDYMIMERIMLYLDRLALEKEDVFQLQTLDYRRFYPEASEEELRVLMREAIEFQEAEGVTFELTEQEREAALPVKVNRPRLP